MNFTKLLAVLSASLMWIGFANAAEIGSTGISIGVESVAEYNIDTELSTITIEPELGYDMMGWVDLTASSKMSLYNGNDWLWDEDFEPTLNVKASRDIIANVSVYAKSGYSWSDSEMTDIVIGASWSW
tara:strand:- start:303 stop:686 length:384 start_codon:yes stop_codon:yes gene_type:complete